MEQSIQETVRFFELLFKPTQAEISQITSDAQQDLQFESKQIFDLTEVYDKMQKLSQQIKQLVDNDYQRISRLAGSLALYLIQYADAQGAYISPIVNSLEEEGKMKLFAKGTENAQGGRAIYNTNLIDQTKKLLELEQKLAEKEQECVTLQKLLEARVDYAPYYQNLVKMLKKKTEEIEQLRGEK